MADSSISKKPKRKQSSKRSKNEKLYTNIMYVRKKIDNMSNKCIEIILKEIDKTRSLAKNYSDASYGNVLNCLKQQHREFEAFTLSLKQESHKIYEFGDADYRLKELLNIMKREAEVFKHFLPAYAVKSKVLNFIQDNQVTIIISSLAYHFNLALPLFLYDKFPNHSIISCESSKALSIVLKKRIECFLHDEGLHNEKISIYSEQQLLQMFLHFNSKDNNSSKAYCVVYNVPLKRSITTDILIANLRDFVAQGKEFRLVLLLSKHNSVQKFEKYFACQKISCFPFRVPDLIFPVKTVWRSELSNLKDYIKAVVDTIISIHMLNESGDIIAYLPSDADVVLTAEKLDVNMHKNHCHDLIVFCTDGTMVKTNSNSDSKQCRKVFLVSSSEDGLIIPSVKYVIDCGIQEDSIFDSENDTSILTPHFISKAKAQSRKETAGVHCAGICYRLYSKENYKEMLPNESPEIFYSNPVISFLHILKYISCPSKNIQLIESLPLNVQTTTFTTLKEYDAIDNLSVTPEGLHLAKLPFPPKYSRLLLLSLEWGFIYEAVILVAFFLNKSGIFIQAENANQQRKIESEKMNFYQDEGDTFTYLKIFKACEENECKEKWCLSKCLNFDTLKAIRSKVREISYMIEKYFKITIEKCFTEAINYNLLLELLCISFSKQLSVFTGHYRIGYEILATKKYALIHPSSFLFQKPPSKFIIYDKIIRGSKDSMLCLTCIPEEIITKLHTDGKLLYGKSELFDEKLAMRVTEPVGDEVISEMFLENGAIGAQELEKNLKRDLGVKVLLIEHNFKSGCISVFAQPADIFNCFSTLNEVLERKSKDLINKVDFNVIQLKKGDKSINVKLKCVKGDLAASFEHLFENNPDAPQQSVPPTKDSSGVENSCAINYLLKLSWKRRFCVGNGFVTFHSRKDFEKARKLINTTVNIGEKEVFVDFSQSVRWQLLLTGIPPDGTYEDIIDSLVPRLPNSDFEVNLSYSPPFETKKEKLKEVQKQIKDICKTYTNLLRYEVEVMEPKPNDICMTAAVNVFELRDLENEAENIRKNADVSGMKINAETYYYSNTKCSSEMYKALQFHLKVEFKKFQDDTMNNYQGKTCRYNPTAISSEEINIELSSNDIEIMRAFQRILHNILDGVKLTKNNLPSIHKLFCHGGYLFLKNLEKTENVYILQKKETKMLRLYGLKENCNRVVVAIREFLADTDNEAAISIDLNLVRHGHTVLKQIILHYGVYLETFIETNGLRSAALDLKNCCIMVNGKKESVQKAEECVKLLCSSISPDNQCHDLISEEECVLCTCFADTLMYRLEVCGHIYCSTCIQYLMEQADFPLQCAAQGCFADIILNDIKNVLENDEGKLKDLCYKSLKSFQEKNKNDLFFCPTPDCPMFYYKTNIKEEKIQCPLCLYFLCVACQVVFHEGYSCDIYQNSQLDPDYQLKVYEKNNPDCKACPSCGTRIEKTEGCNHMTCRCGCHICWLCLEHFSTGNQVYAHINRVHPNQLFA